MLYTLEPSTDLTSSPSCGWWRARTWLQRSARCNPRWPTCTRGRGPIQPPGTCHRWTDAVWRLGPKCPSSEKNKVPAWSGTIYIYHIWLQYITITFCCVSLFAQTVPRGAPGQQALVLCKAGGVEARIAHIRAEDIVGEAWLNSQNGSILDEASPKIVYPKWEFQNIPVI